MNTWLALVNSEGKIEEFSNKSLALSQVQNREDALLIDVLNNKIVVNSSRTKEKFTQAKEFAVKKGFFIDSCRESEGVTELCNFYRKHFDPKNDSLLFISTISLLILAHYLSGYSEILSGEIFY